MLASQMSEPPASLSPGLAALTAALYAKQPDWNLYHYTSLAAMMSIVESRKMWASEIRYLNDSQELRHFENSISGAVRDAEKRTDETSEIVRQFGAWLKERVEKGPMAFVVSLSERGNLLSQWRGYCPHGQGVSLGFGPAGLVRAAAAGGFTLGRCIYDMKSHNGIVVQVLNLVVQDARAVGPSNQFHPSQSYHGFFQEIEGHILRIAALLKHPSFSEEQEWRAVSKPISHYVTNPICYRVGRTTLVPYLEWPLAEPDGVIDLPHVIVGPTLTPNLSIGAVSKYLSKYIPGHTRTVAACDIPYRV